MKRTTDKLKGVLTALLVFLLIFSLLFLVRGWVSGRFDSVDSMREYIGSFGVFGPLVLDQRTVALAGRRMLVYVEL